VAEVSSLEINAESTYDFTYKRIDKELSASTLRITFNKDNYPEAPNSVSCNDITGFDSAISCKVETSDSDFYIEVEGFSENTRRIRFTVDSIQNSLSSIRLGLEIGNCQLFNIDGF